LALFSVMYNMALLLLVLEKNRPLISGPVWFSFSLDSNSPEELRTDTSPYDERLLNS
jgi:hypothetical protein